MVGVPLMPAAPEPETPDPDRPPPKPEEPVVPEEPLAPGPMPWAPWVAPLCTNVNVKMSVMVRKIGKTERRTKRRSAETTAATVMVTPSIEFP